jgi:hypothetical protein
MSESFDPPQPDRDEADTGTEHQAAPSESAPILPADDQSPAVLPAGSDAGSYLESYARRLPPMRIPNIVDVIVLLIVLLAATLVSLGLLSHVFPAASAHADKGSQASPDVAFMLGTQAVTYVTSFLVWLLVFPALWHEKFFSGIQWRAAAALRWRWRLLAAAFACLLLAFLDAVFLPGPENAPIDQVFMVPGAAWLMFAFGTTLAPFIEEMVFRGFLLPAFSTAWDWAVEQIRHRPAPWPDPERGTVWSLPAMIVGSVLTSIPFALMHAEQTGNSLGPFVLLFCVSMILCWVRLSTRSLAASTIVHACYNLLLFSLMLLGTGGFKHMDKM